MLQLKDKPNNALAWERFLEMGLPSKDHEAFRYVHLKELFSHSFCLPKSFQATSKHENALVFHNGSFRPDLSHLPTALIALPLSEAHKTYGNFLNARSHKLLKEEKDPFALVNGAYCTEGLFLYLPPKRIIEGTLHIIHTVDSFAEPTLFCPRVHFFAGKGASAHLTYRQKIPFAMSWSNFFIDFALEEGAHISFTNLSEQHTGAHDFLALRATLKERSLFKSFAVATGAATSRQDYVIRLQGEGANASLYGVWDVKQERQHHVHVEMDHHQPFCTSLQKFKGVARDTARTSFEGKIYVHPQAQKTEAYQMNNNLVLSGLASAYSKPNLEIFADDVKASHGSTIGQLQEEQLFYLAARGVPLEKARSLLIRAFCQEIIDLLEDPHLREEAAGVIA